MSRPPNNWRSDAERSSSFLRRKNESDAERARNRSVLATTDTALAPLVMCPGRFAGVLDELVGVLHYLRECRPFVGREVTESEVLRRERDRVDCLVDHALDRERESDDRVEREDDDREDNDEHGRGGGDSVGVEHLVEPFVDRPRRVIPKQSRDEQSDERIGDVRGDASEECDEQPPADPNPVCRSRTLGVTVADRIAHRGPIEASNTETTAAGICPSPVR